MMNVFAEQSSLTWEQHGNPWLPGHHYATTDGKYRITPQPSPWEPEDRSKYVWAVEVPMYGEGFYRVIKAAPTFSEAVESAEKDSASPVWREDDGDCRWCGMAKSDLIAYPRWWFGCNLCETAIATEASKAYFIGVDVPDVNAPTDRSDNEFEPRHD